MATTTSRPGATQGAFDGLAPVVGRIPVPVREAVKGVVRATATATARWRPGPDFLVIGSKRGGTTTLYHALVRHPAVVPLVPKVQRIKSPHYFDLHHDRSNAWYRSHFPVPRAGRISGEAAPYLLYHPLAPQRVAAEAPQALLVAMLRDPVERAFSHHWDRVKNGVETLSFTDAVDAEAERLAGEEEALLLDPERPRHNHEHFSYLDRGHYDVQLRRWLAEVPAARLLVMRSEDFYADPAATFTDTCRFLGIDAWTPEEFGRHHAHQDRPKVDPAVRQRLWAHFRGSTGRLADLLGTTPWWDAVGTTPLDDRQVLLADGRRP
jgi:hypothetical protein